MTIVSFIWSLDTYLRRLGRLPIRPKFSATTDIVHHPAITIRSRTPNATSSAKANSQREFTSSSVKSIHFSWQ